MELRELAAAGWADRLMKSFNRMDKPAAIFTIFCTGDIDFVGGYVFYNFLMQDLFGGADSEMGKPTLEGSPGEGTQVHEILF